MLPYIFEFLFHLIFLYHMTLHSFSISLLLAAAKIYYLPVLLVFLSKFSNIALALDSKSVSKPSY